MPTDEPCWSYHLTSHLKYIPRHITDVKDGSSCRKLIDIYSRLAGTVSDAVVFDRCILESEDRTFNVICLLAPKSHSESVYQFR